MIGKIMLSLLIGALVSGVVYVLLGLLRRGGSDEPDTKKVGSGMKPVKAKKEKKKRPTDDDDDSGLGGGKGSDLTPTKEWVGGFRG